MSSNVGGKQGRFSGVGRLIMNGFVFLLFTVLVVVVAHSVYRTLQMYDPHPERPLAIDQVDKNAPPRLSVSVGLGNASEEHLIKMQEAVLKDIEASNAETKAQVDMAMLVCGLVGSVVSFFMVFFGYNTVKEANEAKDRAQDVLGKLNRELEKAEQTRAEIERMVMRDIRPKLAYITNYGMKVAEFAGESFRTMSVQDQLRNCDEARKLLKKAKLGKSSDMALSFILARKGVALLDENRDLLEAAHVLEQACAINPHHKPDRPYNLACAFSKLAIAPGTDAAKKAKYIADAIKRLRECLEMADDKVPLTSTVSKAYFVGKIKTDQDLNAVRSDPDFQNPEFQDVLNK